jgi:PAS domain S-box-containing protein
MTLLSAFFLQKPAAKCNDIICTQSVRDAGVKTENHRSLEKQIMGSSLNILLAHDEEIVHKTIAGYLRDSGHHVDKVYDAHAALRAVQRRDYDMALVDIRVSGMDDLFLLARLRKIHPEMPVIIITENCNMDMMVRALRLGATDFLTKPVKLLELDAVLEKSNWLRTLFAQHKHLEEALQESKRRYHLLAENVMVLVWEMDMNLRFTYVSPSVTRMLGYSVAEAMELNWEGILTDDSKKIVEKPFTENTRQASFSESWILEMDLKRKDGSIACVETKLSSICGSDGQPVGILGISREKSKH